MTRRRAEERRVDEHAGDAAFLYEQLEVLGARRTLLEEQLAAGAAREARRGRISRELLDALQEPLTPRDGVENRARVLEYLWNHSCVDCGESDPIILEFDHVTGKKRESISLAVSRGWGWASIEAEIAKCEVRCANCHARKTARKLGSYRTLVQLRPRRDSNAQQPAS